MTTTAADSLFARLELKGWIEPLEVELPGNLPLDVAHVLIEEFAQRLEAIQPHIEALARKLMHRRAVDSHALPSVQDALAAEYMARLQDAVAWLWWTAHAHDRPRASAEVH